MKHLILTFTLMIVALNLMQAQLVIATSFCSNCDINVGNINVTTISNFTHFDAGTSVTGPCNNTDYFEKSYTVDGNTWSPNNGALELADGCYTFCVHAKYQLPSGNICAEDFNCKDFYIGYDCNVANCNTAVSGSIPSTLSFQAQSASFDSSPACKTASTNESWISIDNVTDSRVYFSVSKNQSSNQRIGYIKVEFSGNYTDIPITQNREYFSPNSDTQASKKENQLSTNLRSDFSFEYTIYPVPAKNKININIEDQSSNQFKYISIIDVTGKKVISKVSDEKHLEIDISNLSNGLYFIKVKNAENEINTKMFTKL